MLDEFEDLLRRIREMEEKVDPCPCPDESKMDWLKALRRRVEDLEKKVL